MFKGKKLLVTGGTGSFGNAVVSRFLDMDLDEIRIFSRDEKKQDDMRRHYHNDKLKFYLGNVRDVHSLENAMYGVDYIFHAAALKQVPSCEFFPMEAVHTNIIGTENVMNTAVKFGVSKVICLSTDKAVYPVNAMGTSKAMMEKLVIAKSRAVSSERTIFCVTRYGNVMASRGSVIPLFIEQLKSGQAFTVTAPKMTRFIMSLSEALDLVLFAFNHAQSGDILVQKSSACTIEVLLEAIRQIFNTNNPVKIIGTRHGEKMYETLLSNEEYAVAIDMDKFYRVPADNRDMNYEKYFSIGDIQKCELTEFSSLNTPLLDVQQVKERLLELDYIQKELKSWR